MFNKQFFIESITESYNNYNKFGPRSTEKIKPIHRFIAVSLENIFGKNSYEYHFNTDGNQEFKVKGKYYEKNIDITVTKNSKPIFCVGVKFITSNYKQNANNYFENMMGETANIQANENIPYAHFIIFRDKIPYYKKSKSYSDKKELKKDEIISENDLKKYLNLEFDQKQAHRPFSTGIIIINIDDEKDIKIINFNEIIENKELSLLLENNLSADNFFKKIKDYSLYINTK